MKTLSLVALLLLSMGTMGCLNKIPAVAKYQADATKECHDKYILTCSAGHNECERQVVEMCKPATGCTHNEYGDCTASTK